MSSYNLDIYLVSCGLIIMDYTASFLDNIPYLQTHLIYINMAILSFLIYF